MGVSWGGTSSHYLKQYLYILWKHTMLQTESEVIIADNTGAKTGKVISILKGSSGKKGTIWDKVVIAIKSVTPASSFKKGDVAKAVIVRTKKWVTRKDWSLLRFNDNAVALVDKDNGPIWKRIFGPVARELREVGFKDVATLAEEVI